VPASAEGGDTDSGEWSNSFGSLSTASADAHQHNVVAIEPADRWRHRAIRPRAHGFCRRLCGFARPSAATAAGRSPRLPLALALQRFRRFVKDFYRCGDPSRTCKNDPHATPMLQCSRSFHGKSSIMLRPLLKGRNAHSSEGPDLACLTAGSAHVHHQFQQSGGGTHDE
jgi:hypothetical protein